MTDEEMRGYEALISVVPPEVRVQLDRIEDKLDWLHAQAFVDTAERWRGDPEAKLRWPGNRQDHE